MEGGVNICRCECHDPALHMGWGGPDKHCSNCQPLSTPDVQPTYEQLLDKCAALAAENELLRKVAEAAEALAPIVARSTIAWNMLRDTLTVWRASQVEG